MGLSVTSVENYPQWSFLRKAATKGFSYLRAAFLNKCGAFFLFQTSTKCSKIISVHILRKYLYQSFSRFCFVSVFFPVNLCLLFRWSGFWLPYSIFEQTVSNCYCMCDNLVFWQTLSFVDFSWTTIWRRRICTTKMPSGRKVWCLPWVVNLWIINSKNSKRLVCLCLRRLFSAETPFINPCY